MPLLDHFRPPVFPRHHWDSFHSNWATRLADQISDRLPSGFMVEENRQTGGRLEIDVVVYDEPDESRLPVGGNWKPAEPGCQFPTTFPETFEVRVFDRVGGATLVGAIELISPANKDRAEGRRSFAIKCASLLDRGVSVILVDVVTTLHANLHNELLDLIDGPAEARITAEGSLYASAYRPAIRDDRSEMDVWTTTFSLGDRLPTMPLRLTGDIFLPVDLDSACVEACRKRKIG